MHLHFAEPRWLWAGGAACLALGALFVRAARRRDRAVAQLAGTGAATSLSAARRRLKQALLLVGIAALFGALARPQAGFRWEETRRQGIDLMFAVDTSKSMLAADLRPDRLTRAKLAVRDLVRALPGERFGLIAFAGDAFVQAPMTTDEAVFEESLDALDTSVIPRGGTDLASAIRTATTAMSSEADRRKVLILLSDGEDLAGGARAAALEAARHGLTIYTVGVGTAAGGLIAARDEAGQPVRSRLDEATLTAVAQATGGTSVALGPSGGGLQTLYRTELAKLPRTTTAERWRKVYTERFQIPLAVGLACLLAELAIGERRRTGWRTAAVAGAGLVVLVGGAPAHAQPAAPDVTAYNAGTGAYRQRDFAAAQQRFQAATRAGELGVQEKAYYDLGNARFRVGEATAKKDPASTIEAWKGALAAYDGALALDRGDGDARFNRDLVARKLAALQEQEQRKQQQQENNNQQNQPQRQKAGEQQQHSQQQSGQAGQQQQSGQAGQQQQSGQAGQQQAKGQAGQQQAKGQAGQQQQSGQAGQQQQSGQAGQEQAKGQGAQQQGQQQPAQLNQQGQQPERQQQAGQQQQPGPEQQAGQAQGAAQQQGAQGGTRPGEPGSPPAEPGAAPEPAPRGAAAPTPATEGRADQSSHHAAPERKQPGALSRGEADQLLDSLDGQMQRLPIAAYGKRPAAPDEQPTKDW